MVTEDRDALICDLAETYHILNMKAYPVSLIATLATGLRSNSRIKMRMEGQNLTQEEGLLALIYDRLNWLRWAKTKDGEKNRNIPASLYEYLSGAKKQEKKEEITVYTSPEEFEKRRLELLG